MEFNKHRMQKEKEKLRREPMLERIELLRPRELLMRLLKIEEWH
jgi:hypothetical protein